MIKRKPGQLAARWDPTYTSSIVTQWAREAARRLARLAAEVKQTVAVQDDYDLRRDGLKTHAKKYAFQTSAEKLVAFKEWLESRAQYHLLDMVTGPTMQVHEGKWWADKYVMSAYKKGMVRAAQEMKKRGFKQYQNLMPVELQPTPERWASMAITSPVHADRVALIFSRTYEDLKGITSSMAKSMTDILADGMVGGEDPYAVAKNLTAAIDTSKARANMIARTETIRAHHVASINTYREAGLEGVEVQAELATVARGTDNHKDLHVCPLCQALEKQTQKNPVSLDEAEGLIPVHPNCRCVAIPRVLEEEEE